MRNIVCAGLLMVLLGAAGVYSASSVQFKGLIINTSDTSIEIKQGRSEVVIFWTGNSKVLKDGRQSDRGAVEICQKVKADYIIREGRKELVSLDILKDSYCRK